jgi:hypothetical protein
MRKQLPTRSGRSATPISAIALTDPTQLDQFLAQESGRLFEFSGLMVRCRLGRTDHELPQSFVLDAMIKFATWARSEKLADKLGNKVPARYRPDPQRHR